MPRYSQPISLLAPAPRPKRRLWIWLVAALALILPAGAGVYADVPSVSAAQIEELGALFFSRRRLSTFAGVDRALLTKRFVAITDKPDADLRAAARRLWEAWFEAKLPDLKIAASTVRDAWRH